MAMALHILSAGYTTIDLIENNRYVGGGAAIMAINAGTLGYSSSIACVLSKDKFGKMAQKEFNAHQVDISLCIDSAPTLPTCIIENVFGKGSERKWNDNGAIQYLKDIKIPAEIIGKFDTTFLVNCHPILGTHIAELSPNNLVYIPGPQIVTNPDYAKQEIIEQSTFIFANEEEESHIWEKNPFLGNVELFIVTKGAKGGVIYTDEHNTIPFMVPRTRDVVDTTGAGDSFALGFVTEYIQSQSIPAALKKATELASTVIHKKGGLL